MEQRRKIRKCSSTEGIQARKCSERASSGVAASATEIYNANGFDIALVQRLLQHSSATIQRYIGIEPQKIEQAIQNHANLI